MAGKQSSGKVKVLIALAVVGGGLAALAVPVGLGIYYFYFRGQDIGRVAVSDEPSELELRVPASTRVALWTEVDVRVPVAQNRYQTMNDLPHVVDYAIEVVQGGSVVKSLRCNPFKSTLTDWSSHGTAGPTTSWRYVARIDDCELSVPSGGPVTLRVHRAWLKPGGATFEKSELIARQ